MELDLLVLLLDKSLFFFHNYNFIHMNLVKYRISNGRTKLKSASFMAYLSASSLQVEVSIAAVTIEVIMENYSK